MVKWQDIPGYEDYYQISSELQIKSLARTIIRSDGKLYSVKEKILSKYIATEPEGKQYWMVGLHQHGTTKVQAIHRLYLLSFVGPAPEGFVGCHRDDNSLNNDPDNLYWGSLVDNAQDALSNGKNPWRNKTHCPQDHEYTEDNTYIWYKNGAPQRRCKICNTASVMRSYRKRAALTSSV